MSITLDGTNGITAANVFGRNVIINGDGRINQRGYTSGTATSGAGEYTLDRWKVVTSGQNLTFTGDDSRRVMTAPAGGVEQVIEDKNIVGGTYVINWDGTATATVNGSAVTKGSTFTLTANTNATLRMIDGTFSDVQIETGSVATPFERRPYGTELQLCQRYYYRLSPGASGRVLCGSAFASGTGSVIGHVPFPVTMRAAPFALEQTGTAGDYAAFIGSTAYTGLQVPSLNAATTADSSIVALGGLSGLTNGQAGIIQSLNAAAYLGWTAEL